ncbi:hypothetical protein BLOT_001205 [Blomia tropicalis]|nr:hypothetical protein BLOT_001205 [Blomia tropicalis]
MPSMPPPENGVCVGWLAGWLVGWFVVVRTTTLKRIFAHCNQCKRIRIHILVIGQYVILSTSKFSYFYLTWFFHCSMLVNGLICSFVILENSTIPSMDKKQE